ncbi:MAG: hypothetical protein HC793_00280 [Aquincola sp.]|nr:hypothetical protein [Aquincola sp.]
MSSSQPSVSSSAAPVVDQIAAALVGGINEERLAHLGVELAKQEQAFIEALDAMEQVRNFVSHPGNILGSTVTKHGEIAEAVEVGVRRAKDLIDGIPVSAEFGELSRTGPADYLIDGVEVQSKFINSTNDGLRHVLEHLRQYPQFASDGRYYHIPSEQHEQILKVLGGESGELNQRSVSAILEKVRTLESQSGRPFVDLVRPSESTYADVQLGRIDENLDRRQGEFSERNDGRVDQIQQEHEPSLGEGAHAALAGGAVGASVGFAGAAFKKYREGKNVFRGDFDKQDWKDVGGEALTSGALGAVAGASIYLLTNAAGLSAPFAGALVSAAKGVAPLIAAHQRGELSMEALVDTGLFVCSDVAIVAGCTALGQALIPVPILGAVVGSLAGKVLSHLIASQLKGSGEAIQARLSEYLKNLDEQAQAALAKVVAAYDRLGDLTVAAFDFVRNVNMVELSIQLARSHSVEASKLLTTEAEIDRYMLD